MNLITFFWKSSIGKKWLVALTGLVLIGYVIGHMVGNLQIFLGPERINAYAQFLHSMPIPLLLIRIFLLACLGLHIAATIKLTVENRAAKGQGYVYKNHVRTTIAARTMVLSGLIVLCFVIFHLLQFTIRSTDPRFRPEELGGLLNGEYDVYTMLVLAFQNVFVAFFYLLAVGLLCLHLSHGFSSVTRTLGVISKTLEHRITMGGKLLSILIFAGYASIPLAVFFGILTLKP